MHLNILFPSLFSKYVYKEEISRYAYLGFSVLWPGLSVLLSFSFSTDFNSTTVFVISEPYMWQKKSVWRTGMEDKPCLFSSLPCEGTSGSHKQAEHGLVAFQILGQVTAFAYLLFSSFRFQYKYFLQWIFLGSPDNVRSLCCMRLCT